MGIGEQIIQNLPEPAFVRHDPAVFIFHGFGKTKDHRAVFEPDAFSEK